MTHQDAQGAELLPLDLANLLDLLDAHADDDHEYGFHGRAELFEKAATIIRTLYNSRRAATQAEPAGEATLPRYGIKWNGPAYPICEPMDDGYWTPHHLAMQAILALSRPSSDAGGE